MHTLSERLRLHSNSEDIGRHHVFVSRLAGLKTVSWPSHQRDTINSRAMVLLLQRLPLNVTSVQQSALHFLLWNINFSSVSAWESVKILKPTRKKLYPIVNCTSASHTQQMQLRNGKLTYCTKYKFPPPATYCVNCLCQLPRLR